MPITDLSQNPFMSTDPAKVVSKLAEPVGVEELDNIREITFSSLNTETPVDLDNGVMRAVQLLYTLGLGFFIRHAFGFSDDFLQKLRHDDSSIKGKPLKEILENSEAYEALFREYKKVYARQPYYNADLVKLCEIEKVYPSKALALVKLLMLVVISTKFEE